MKITGQADFIFSGFPIGPDSAKVLTDPTSYQKFGTGHVPYLYSGTISKPLLKSPFTGYYEFVPAPAVPGIPISHGTVRRKAGSDFPNQPVAPLTATEKYELTATGDRPSGVYSTPHGIGYNDITYASRAGLTGHFNFYMAFYGPGYYQTRAGELLTLGEATSPDSPSEGPKAHKLSSIENAKIFGLRLVGKINSSNAQFYACKSFGPLQNVHEGTHDCPLKVKPAYKFEPVYADFSAGTYIGGIGGNPYNHNPLPSPYDRGVYIASSLYKSKFEKVNDVDGCYYEAGPIPAINIRSAIDANGGTTIRQQLIGSRLSDGNASVCPAGADGEDSSVAAYVEDGAGDSPPHYQSTLSDTTSDPIFTDISYNSRNAYWHYVFKYNHYSLPSFNSSETSAGMVKDDSLDEMHWWETRECPENIDFLNHAFGNNITACPMNYLDVPYYASIGKFGYFGTRFQNTWRMIKNEGATGHWDQVAEDGFGFPKIGTFFTMTGTGASLFKITIESSGTSPVSESVNEGGEEFELAVGDTLELSPMIGVNEPGYLGDGKVIGELEGAVLSVKTTSAFLPMMPSTTIILPGKELKFLLEEYTPTEYKDYPPLPDEYSPHGSVYSPIPTDQDYDDLLMVSIKERARSSCFISDKVLFLKLNHDVIKTTNEYAELKKNNKSFEADFNNFLLQHTLPEVGSETLAFSRPDGLSNRGMDSLLAIFSMNLGESFEALVRKYGHAKLTKQVTNPDDIKGAIDIPWYNKLINKKISTFANNYYRNIANGKPVDLFPDGVITFSSEVARQFAESDFLKYHSMPSSANLRDPVTNLYPDIPSTDLRYFHTAFSSQTEADLFKGNAFLPSESVFPLAPPPATREIGRLTTASSPVFQIDAQTKSFYLGYLNPKGCTKDLPKGSRSFLKMANLPIAGIWQDYAPEDGQPVVSTPPGNAASPARIFSEDIGASLDRNFSCFSPLFLQQPINTHTKSWLPATLRVFAVDYHSITEDKIRENTRVFLDDGNEPVAGNGRPEIGYWLRKIKAIDSKGKNLYPLKYEWFRILNTDIPEYLKTKKESLLHPPDPQATAGSHGDWACFEGKNSPDCTVVTRRFCSDLYGNVPTFPTNVENLLTFAGINKATALKYSYFCRVTGRLGWRDSELCKIVCDSSVEMEFAYINSAGSGNAFQVAFSEGGSGTVGFSNQGLQHDPHVVFEDEEERIWNSGNNCESWRFIGREAIGGLTRVWTPATLKDPRGKTVRKAHWTAFGALSKMKITDNESLCWALYAKRALPFCDINQGILYRGISISLAGVIHRTAADTATLTYNSRVGLIVSRMKNIAELYPPPSMDGYFAGSFPGSYLPYVQPAHFQFENHLGLIKSFSRNISGPSAIMGRMDIQKIGGGAAPLSDLIHDAKNKIFYTNIGKGSRVISGPECGYVRPSAGRFMHFYVETFDTFFSLCDEGKKPVKVKNWSHIAGGLRANNAGLQFNWLGKPKNARLKRESIPGPYGFQWKVERHNRDRSGNGMSLGFWSYHHETRIDNMYDAAAVVGALKRLRPSPHKMSSASSVRANRMAAANDLGFSSSLSFRNVRFGPDDGKKLGCGNIRIKDEENGNGAFKPTKNVALYSQTSSSSSGELRDFGCEGVNKPDCFFPCVSLKWPDGFSPKGKKMMGGTITSCADCDEATPLIVQPSAAGLSIGSIITTKKIFRKKISPCADEHRDSCNYITPTIHLGIDCWLAGSANAGVGTVGQLLTS